MINEIFQRSKMKYAKLIIIVLKLAFISHNVVASQSNIDDASTRRNYLGASSLVRNYNNLTRIGDILDLFSVDVIGQNWSEKIHKRLSSGCAFNMMEYLSGLEQKEIWAIKSKMLECLSAVVESENGQSFTFSSG